MRMAKPSKNIEEFYNNFSRAVLSKDFCGLNPRHQAITKLCKRYIRKGAKILEIGCGVGIVSNYLGKIGSRVLSVDISDTNARIAREYCKNRIVEFRQLDICEYHLSEKFDAVVLADVIEHIPIEKHSGLFHKIETILSPEGIILITWPSPEYQEFLRKQNPAALQIVDETVYPTDLFRKTTCTPIYFSYMDIFGQNQYTHLVLKRNVYYSPKLPKKNFLEKGLFKLKSLIWKWRNEAFISKIDCIFKEIQKRKTA